MAKKEKGYEWGLAGGVGCELLSEVFQTKKK